jgi:hypothetical protein
MEFETIFARIDKMRAALRAEFDVDAERSIAEIDRALEAEIAKDPLLAYASNLFYRAAIALRNQRIDVARKLQSNGVAENVEEMHGLAFNSHQIDALTRLMAPGERYLPGQSTPRGLRTSLRIYPRSELTAACRTSAQMNDAKFARGFPNEAEVAAAEERLAEANKPPIAPGSRGTVSNSDWPRR